MRVEYDPRINAAYIYLTEFGPGGAVTTVPGWPDTEAFGVDLDFDRDGRLVGIEVTGATNKLPPDFLAKFAQPS